PDPSPLGTRALPCGSRGDCLGRHGRARDTVLAATGLRFTAHVDWTDGRGAEDPRTSAAVAPGARGRLPRLERRGAGCIARRRVPGQDLGRREVCRGRGRELLTLPGDAA